MLNYLKRKEANTAKKMILDADDGEEFYLMIQSQYSDLYRNNRSIVLREAAASKEGFTEQNQQMLHAKLLSSSIVEWSVPKEFGDCETENIEKFLIEYPEIADNVDIFSGNEAEFIAKKSKH